MQKDRKDLVLIDFEKKCNQLRLFFGDGEDPWGDDWDDAPYQHNAGRVYSEFIKDTAVLSFYYDDIVYEPADDYTFQDVSKEMMLKKRVPAFVALPVKYREPESYWKCYSFAELLADSHAIPFYFGITVKEIEKILNKHFPKTFLDFSENFNYF